MENFRNGAAGNTFTGAMDLQTGRVYLFPVTPDLGRNPNAQPYPNELAHVRTLNGGVMSAPPIAHNQRNPAHPILQADGASHLQIVGLIIHPETLTDAHRERFVGFSVTKGNQGNVESFGGMSRSLNSAKFPLHPTAADRQQRTGLMTQPFAEAILSSVKQAVQQAGQ
ncbi:hypothetical protein JRI60_48975 [Archangium violaceum]|uniref:hypothetical protein n=1 Tax=Archangium violaceum TaxID=83451 RepID=UPI0019523A83|nr:hypothetical protein [Archangium violaceum]QRN96832.1 hypothetical protein JRI60_48975 [Archangium violaceum]